MDYRYLLGEKLPAPRLFGLADPDGAVLASGYASIEPFVDARFIARQLLAPARTVAGERGGLDTKGKRSTAAALLSGSKAKLEKKIADKDWSGAIHMGAEMDRFDPKDYQRTAIAAANQQFSAERAAQIKAEEDRRAAAYAAEQRRLGTADSGPAGQPFSVKNQMLEWKRQEMDDAWSKWVRTGDARDGDAYRRAADNYRRAGGQ
jgi:hypothetical protein